MKNNTFPGYILHLIPKISFTLVTLLHQYAHLLQETMLSIYYKTNSIPHLSLFLVRIFLAQTHSLMKVMRFFFNIY